MTQMFTSKTILKISLFVLLITSISSEVKAGRKVSLSELKFELSAINNNDLSIIIWDQRPQVSDKSNPEFFLGYIRSITGIAWPYYMKEQGKLSTTLGGKIVSSYQTKGSDVDFIESSAFNNYNDIIDLIKAQENSKVLLIKMNELHFDGVAKIGYVVDLEIQILNKQGDILFKDQRVEKIPMGGAGKHKKTVPATLKTVFESVLNKQRILDAINAEGESPAKLKSDVILKRDGEEINAKIIEIDDQSIRYKPMNHLEGPTRVISITDVFMITYENGLKEVYN